MVISIMQQICIWRIWCVKSASGGIADADVGWLRHILTFNDLMYQTAVLHLFILWRNVETYEGLLTLFNNYSKNLNIMVSRPL